MPSQQTKFKNPYLKVIKGRIVPACEIEKRQQKLTTKQQQQQRCNRLNGWLDHKFQNLSYCILDCFDKRKHHYNSSTNSSNLNDSFDSWDMNTSFSSNTTSNLINATNNNYYNSNPNNHDLIIKDILNKNNNMKHHRHQDDNLSIVGDLFIFSCSPSMNTYETTTDHGYFSLDGSINANYLKQSDTKTKKNTQSYNVFQTNKQTQNKKKIKSLTNLSKKVKFNLLHSMTSSSSFTNPKARHRHNINHVSIIENEYERCKNSILDNDVDENNENTRITFAYLFGNLNLFASIDDDDDEQEDIDSCLILENNSEECENNCCINSSDAHSFSIDFSSVINSEEDDALSYDITSL
jgi:hypothetical protein